MENAAPAVDPVAAPQGQPAAPAAKTPQPGTQDAPAIPVSADIPAAPAAAPEGNQQPAAQNWSDNWRQLMAEGVGGDEKLLKRLDRFTSPAEVLKWALNAEKKISSGEYKKALGKDASPEDIAAWKAENGVPENPADYLADIDGLVIGEEDKEGIDFILSHAAKSNIPKQYVQEIVKSYDAWREQTEQHIAEQDAQFAREADDKLRAEWGGEYRLNQNAVKNFAYQAFGEEMAEQIFNARLPDGSVFGNNPELNMAFASLARELNPAATLLPPGTSNSLSTLDDEIKAIEKQMRDDRHGYFKDAAKQKRYGDLLAARDKLK